LRDKISDKDKKDWESFLSNKEKLHDKDFRKIKQKNFKIKRLDLHGYSLAEANIYIKNFIFDCYSNGFTKLIVVTGKGLHSDNNKNPYLSKDMSILKYSVPEFIKNDEELMKMILDIKEAKIEDGGSGSFYIYLKKKK
tara:strand:- start:50 stop:463 length:414 start_codon:yes stop_codon:yes gene_type:complete